MNKQQFDDFYGISRTLCTHTDHIGRGQMNTQPTADCETCGYPLANHPRIGCEVRESWWPDDAVACPSCTGLSMEALQDCVTCNGFGYVITPTVSEGER